MGVYSCTSKSCKIKLMSFYCTIHQINETGGWQSFIKIIVCEMEIVTI